MTKTGAASVDSLLTEASPSAKQLMVAVHAYFAHEAHCDAYVKTIYVGYQLGTEMVAAVYPHARSVEVALALPDNLADPQLIDAAHLTWRTMPVAIEIGNRSQLGLARPLFERAVERVRTGVHDVELPQERFMGRSRTISDQRVLGRRDRPGVAE